jgi:acetate kinase
MNIEEIDRLLNKESGLKGICGLNDMRDIHRAIAGGNERARLALEVQTYRNRKYIGAYMAVLGSVDAIVFTAGIGENDGVVRQKSVQGMADFGITLDPDANNQRITAPALISSPESRVQVWTIPTNEELAIAREAKELLSQQNSAAG